MATTIKDLLVMRAKLYQFKAIYSHIVTDLEQYAPEYEEGRSNAIDSELGPVSKESVESVIQTIKTQYIDQLQKEISALENLEIPDEQEEQDDEDEEAEASSAKEGDAKEAESTESGRRTRKANADRAHNGGGQSNPLRVQNRPHK